MMGNKCSEANHSKKAKDNRTVWELQKAWKAEYSAMLCLLLSWLMKDTARGIHSGPASSPPVLCPCGMLTGFPRNEVTHLVPDDWLSQVPCKAQKDISCSPDHDLDPSDYLPKNSACPGSRYLHVSNDVLHDHIIVDCEVSHDA